MELKNALEITTKEQFYGWLAANHASATECWVSCKRGRKGLTDGELWYIDAVEMALCFGWIDSTVKRVGGRTWQRFTPRRKGSRFTELNKERCRRMERLGLMTDAGRRVLPDMSADGFRIDPDILSALQKDPQTWTNFLAFPALYQRVRIDNIQYLKASRPALFQSRLEKFLANTRDGKMFGEWDDGGRLREELIMNKIETTRLTLRNWTENDAERLYELAKDPSIGEAAGWPPHTSVEMSREVIRTVFNDENTFAIILKSTGDIIGCIGLGFDPNCPIAKDERILGYWLGVEYQGLGYTTEAAQSLIAKAFEDGVAGIWCGNFAENRASARVQEKCGFRFRFDDADKNWGMTDEGRLVTMRYLANSK